MDEITTIFPLKLLSHYTIQTVEVGGVTSSYFFVKKKNTQKNMMLYRRNENGTIIFLMKLQK